jgi:hypothetical protein
MTMVINTTSSLKPSVKNSEVKQVLETIGHLIEDAVHHITDPVETEVEKVEHDVRGITDSVKAQVEKVEHDVTTVGATMAAEPHALAYAFTHPLSVASRAENTHTSAAVTPATAV